MFPDVEKLLAQLLVSFVADANHIGTTTPADLNAKLPFVKINRFGGGDDGVTETSGVDVDYLDDNRDDARAGMEQIRQFLESGAHRVGGSLIDLVRVDVGTTERPWSATVRRFGGTFTVSCRRIPT